MNIEQYFSQVYSLHTSSNFFDNSIIYRANTALNLIEQIDEKYYENKVVATYLEYRKMEFNFYKGYCDKDVEARYLCFKYAADGFINIANKFKAKLPPVNFDDSDEIPEAPHSFMDDSNKALTIYMLNSIGESCSKILQMRENLINSKKISVSDKQIKQYGKMAIFYCECAVRWNGENDLVSKREVYYRNYAAALERYERSYLTFGSYSKEILKYYKKAFLLLLNYNEKNYDRINYVYYTLMLYHNKYINHLLKMKSEFKDEKDFYLFISDLNNVDISTIECIKSLYELSDFATNDICLRTYVHCMRGLALRDIILLKKSGNLTVNIYFNKDINYYLDLYEHVIYILNYMELSDDFSGCIRNYKKIFDLYI